MHLCFEFLLYLPMNHDVRLCHIKGPVSVDPHSRLRVPLLSEADTSSAFHIPSPQCRSCQPFQTQASFSFQSRTNLLATGVVSCRGVGWTSWHSTRETTGS
jgi:hypothetical protein